MFSEGLIFFTSPLGIGMICLLALSAVLEYKVPKRIFTVTSAVLAALVVLTSLFLSASLGETLAVALLALILRLCLSLGGKKNDV